MPMLSPIRRGAGHARLSPARVAVGLALAAAAAGATAGATEARSGRAAPPPRWTAAARAAENYRPGVVIVGYRNAPSPALQRDIARLAGAPSPDSPLPQTAVVHLRAGQSVPGAAARLRHLPGVAYAVPDYVAHLTAFVPNDRGRGPRAGDWRRLQWNFLAATGVGAPNAWSHLIRDGAPGGRGVTVAILDTGVAYRAWTDPRTHVRYAPSPDFNRTRFVAPCDLVRDQQAGAMRHGRVLRRCADPDALDRNGHGTLVAGVVSESTNNHIGLTGLAYGATLMPVRVLNAQGDGDALTIARGIRYAVVHGAKVINLSLEFTPNGPDAVGAADIPEVIGAIAFAHAHGDIVVAAAGNDSNQPPLAGGEQVPVAYPAADQPDVISVGATTRDGCLADYSNTGPGLDIVAPGGGEDAPQDTRPGCRPETVLNGGDIYQVTFMDPGHPRRFGIPNGWYGTSMAAPEVAATAALVIASGVLGTHPSPAAVLARLEHTATPLGSGEPNSEFGYGRLNAAAATAGRSLVHRHTRRPAAADTPTQH
jgi:serine protease